MDEITNSGVWYVTKELIYKIYYHNSKGSSTTNTINIAYQIVVEGEGFDLCELRHKLLDNLEKINSTKY